MVLVRNKHSLCSAENRLVICTTQLPESVYRSGLVFGSISNWTDHFYLRLELLITTYMESVEYFS